MDFMTDLAIYVISIVSAFLLLWFVIRARPPKSIYVSRKSEADFYRGKRAPDDGFTSKQKSAIYMRDAGKCAITGRNVWLGEPDESEEAADAVLKLVSKIPGLKGVKRGEGEVDHIIPREFGGASTLENGHLVARSYNRGKSSAWTIQAERLCKKHGWKVYLEPAELKKFKSNGRK